MRLASRHLAFAGVLAAMLTLGSAASAAPEPEGEGEPPVNPAKVAIPFESDFELSLAEGWTITDCAAVTPPPRVEFTCEPTAILLAAPTYEADYGVVAMTVPMTNGVIAESIVYQVSMAPPAAPVGAAVDFAIPVSSGSRVLIPHSDLGVVCEGCTADASLIEVVGVLPDGAGMAFVTPTHVSVAVTPGYVGTIEVGYRVTDAHEQLSEPAVITIASRAASETALVGVHAVVMGDGGPMEFDLRDYFFSPSSADIEFLDCGSPAAGTVDCALGAATFLPADDGPRADQFSFAAFSDDGEFALGSITVLRPDEKSQTGAATGGFSAESESIVIAARPEVEAEATAKGFFAPVRHVVDRVTGRNQ